METAVYLDIDLKIALSATLITLMDLRELKTEMRITKFPSERGGSFLIGLRNKLYPLLDIDFFKRVCPQTMSANRHLLFKWSKT